MINFAVCYLGEAINTKKQNDQSTKYVISRFYLY